MSKICLINKNGGKTSVVLSVNNGGQSGVKFWLWSKKEGENKYEVIEELIGDTGMSGTCELEIQTEILQMENTILTWLIKTCSRIPSAEKLDIKVEFYQDGKKCKTTSDSKYSGQYPDCKDGLAAKNRGQILFTLFEQLEINRLWVNME